MTETPADGFADADSIPDWPPPGLESLHGTALRIRGRAIGATILIAPPMVWLVSGMPVDERPVRIALGLMIACGLFLLLTAILRTARTLDIARRARSLGYSGRILLEVALDDAADTPSLIAGRGAYESVRERTRVRVRALRMLSKSFAIAAAILPLPLLCLAIALALRGSADALAVVMIPLLPLVFFTLTAGIAAAYAAVLAQWDRGGDAWDPSPVTAAERAARWHLLTGTRQRTASTGGGMPFVLIGAAAGVALFVLIAFTTTTYSGYGMLLPRAQFDRDNRYIPEDMTDVELMRDLRLPIDSTITAHDAGVALHNLRMSTRPPVVAGIRPPAARYTDPWTLQRYYSSEYYFRIKVRPGSADRRSGTETVAAIDSAISSAPHDALRDVAILAHAGDIDIVGTRFVAPVTDASVSAWDESGRVTSGFSAYVLVVAGRKFASGDTAGAELLLRQLLSIGFLLIDRSPLYAEYLQGIQLVSKSRYALLAMYHATGRKVEALAIAGDDAAESRARSATDDQYTGHATAPENVGVLLERARRKNVYPALRWSAFQDAIPRENCGSMRAAMFGPDEYSKIVIASSAHSLVRLPSDSLLLDAVLNPRPARTIALSTRPGWRRVQRLVLFTIGDHQVTGPCAGAFTTRF